MNPADTLLPPSPIAGVHVVELGAGSERLLQEFFDANPRYFLIIQGEPAGPTEAHEEIHGELPAGWSFSRKWVLGYVDASDRLIALANLVSDIIAPGVWNVSTFMVATDRYGTGAAQRLYRSLEDWARANGAKWLRLGVVSGNTRGERFWKSAGFVQTRLREGMPFGKRINTLCVMFKPLDGGTLEDYLSLVSRDRPEKNVVLTSLENRFADQCVDVFTRPDGTFGFEESRRDAEDCGQWRNLGRFSHLSFSTQDEALEAAHENVPWLEKRLL